MTRASPAPTLAGHLGTAVGRGTIIERDAQQQLTGDAGTLTTQLCRLLDGAMTEVRTLLAVPADLPPRRAHPWTLLTEFESPAWPVLALSQPPALTGTETARVIRHLATTHIAMDRAGVRRWAVQDSAGQSDAKAAGALLSELSAGQPPTWAALISSVTMTQVHLATLHTWGVLSAYVGMSQEIRLSAAQSLLDKLLTNPDLVQSPSEYAAEALWADLWPLHAGLPRPDAAEITRVAQSLRTLPERTVRAPIPDPEALADLLAEQFPALSPTARRELGERLSGQWPTDPHLSPTGLAVQQQPGALGYWLRRGSEVQLIVSRSPDLQGAPTVRAWRWQLPR